MKLGIIKTISKENFRSKDVPKWVDQLLEPLNQFIEQVGSALQGRLSFQDNFYSNIVTHTLVDSTELEINPNADGNARRRVLGVIPISSGSLAIESFNWNEKSTGNIGVTVTYASGTSAEVRLLILYQ